MKLRGYQEDLLGRIYSAWSVIDNVLAVLPTGGGKTVLFGTAIAQHTGRSVAVAHRQELVGQMSLTLAKMGVRHAIISPKNVIKWIVAQHVRHTGTSYYDPSAACLVAGVDTLIRRGKTDPRVTLWVCDEAQHLLRDNKWGKAMALYPNAKGLGVTATPCRADGMGLGRHADGVFDVLIEGPTGRELIADGFLCDYRIFAPPNDLRLDAVRVSKTTGDYNPNDLKLQVQKSRVMGDVVDHYLRITPGKLGLVFATDVETATEISGKFVASGVSAEVISAKTPARLRSDLVARFSRGDVRVLVNVDIFGEGFDLPALEVVQFARPTESFSLYSQQFGRGLRIMDGKDHAVIIDHVGNVARHRLPDSLRPWSLDRRDRRSGKKRDPDIIPVKTCIKCTGVFEAVYRQCPFCGAAIIPALRSAPEFVDGDLTELDPAVLAALRGEIARIDADPSAIRNKMERSGAPGPAVGGAVKQHRLRKIAQESLREAILQWGGYQQAAGRPDYESYRRFYFKFGVDVLTAQALGRRDAEKLENTIRRSMYA